ncbi:MAG: hypothetical protein K1X82_02650 [Bacteroidia bacterium]|nr:hypothetical protein [Bacteroidia bacterium]
MLKNNYGGLEGLSSFSTKKSWSNSNVTLDSQKFRFVDQEFPTYYDRRTYSDNFGAEVFPIRIVHEPEEILGYYPSNNESSGDIIGGLEFIPSRAIYCLYLPHTWGGRTLPPAPRS